MEVDLEVDMEAIVLVVDDDMTSLKLAKNILGEEYRIAAVNSGDMVFKYLEKNRPDLILLDLNMPDMDGFEVMERLQDDARYESIPVIFLTANQDPQSEAKCLESGAIDFVGKPFVPVVLKSRVRRIIELMQYRDHLKTMVEEQAETITKRTQKISDMQNTVIIGMANLIESRDKSTGRHVKNTQTYVAMIANELQRQGLFPHILTEEYKQNVIKAAPLHDVGKIKVPDAILMKPGKLTEEEYEKIKTHAAEGAKIIDEILGDVEEPDYLQVARDIAFHHHEQWNGHGYPSGLAGEEIPLCARIMTIADVFDALYEDRCYKKGIRPLSLTLQYIEDEKGMKFDPIITDVFLGLKGKLAEYLDDKEEL